MGDQVLGSESEPGPVLTHHVTAQHSEHFWSGKLDDGYSCQQCRPQVQRQDWSCRRGQIFLLPGDDMVEIGNDCAKHSEAPEVVLAREGSRHTSHQQEPGYLGRRCPGSGTALGFIVEELLATKSCAAILLERGGAFVPAFVAKQVDTSKNRRFFEPVALG